MSIDSRLKEALQNFISEVGPFLEDDRTQPAPIASPPPADKTTPGDWFEDHGKFYDYLRNNDMLGPTISAQEFEGVEAIVLAFATVGSPVSYIAYALGTAFLETAGTMQPVKEYGGVNYFRRMYDIQGNRPSKARELGNIHPGDGAKFCGRGYVQLTGRTNYEKASRYLQSEGINVDLAKDPSLARRPDIAAFVMVRGMIEGWFTGRKLSDDLPESGLATIDQFVVSRDIINGRDKQLTIAQYAVNFQEALRQGGYKPWVS